MDQQSTEGSIDSVTFRHFGRGRKHGAGTAISKFRHRLSYYLPRHYHLHMKTPREKLDALLALLYSAAQDAIAEYERTGDVPTKESAHPRDSQHPTIALKNALRILEGACDQLCTTLAPPAHTLLSVSVIWPQSLICRLATSSHTDSVSV